MRWFRLYHEFIDDPKVSMMSDTDQLLWVKTLCLASESSVRGAILLSDDEISWRLRIAKETWQGAADKFRAKGMIEHTQGGYRVSSWDERQFESDSSTSRVAQHRAKKETLPKQASNVSETLDETPPEQIQITDTKTESESDPYQDFVDCYAQWKPSTWKGVRKIASGRLKIVKTWIKTFGRKNALERLEASLRWVNSPSMSFWADKPGNFGMDTLSYKDRLYEWSEAWIDFNSGESGSEISQEAIGAELTRLGRSGLLPPDWAKGTGCTTVSELPGKDAARYLAWLRQQEATHAA